MSAKTSETAGPMTVGDLIVRLQQLDPKALVLLLDDELSEVSWPCELVVGRTWEEGSRSFRRFRDDNDSWLRRRLLDDSHAPAPSDAVPAVMIL